MKWKIIERPGYFGSKRDEIQGLFEREYGSGRWRIAWQFGERILQKPEALQIYEDGYYEYLKANPKIVAWLTDNFLDVFDNALSNINSGFDYNIQETTGTHLQDISIRRSIMRLGKKFNGKGLLEVRSSAEGASLSPCLIPFHLPLMIYRGNTLYQGEIRDFVLNPPWWKKKGIKDSIEEFYQQNKVLEILCDE
jgi:hypothetical protein